MGYIYERLLGKVRLELRGAWTEGLINSAAEKDIELWDLERLDSLTLRLCLYEPDLPAFTYLAEKAMCDVEQIRLTGGSRDRGLLKRRSGLLTLLALAGILLWISSLFVWQVDVQGGGSLTKGQLLRSLAECGVDVGAFRYSIDQDRVRSQMMLRHPEIGWMTVNVSGSRALALVVERQEAPELSADLGPGDVVASHNGIVQKLSVEEGVAQVQPGQAVLEGEVLISGLGDSIAGGSRELRARGQVLAETWRELSAVTPSREEIKTYRGGCHSRFALVLGKRRIDLYFGAGKAIDGYDIMIYEYELGLEGLFALPVKLIREELRPYELEAVGEPEPEALEALLDRQLRLQGRGRVLGRSFTVSAGEELTVVTLRGHCLEDIALYRPWRE